MPLHVGQRIGGYEIRGDLGRGTMGEVYRAVDPRLGREVAMKLLPPRFAADRERLQRFEREARTLAALSHPGIAQIHGFHQVDDLHFLVLEFVPGTTLEERLVAGPLPPAAALDVAAQIAAGLEAAHAAAVIHRDLKPGNVRITPEGRAVVLDFGLAKLVDGTPAAEPHLTQTGRALGTPSYMSPEQLRGQKVDRRADVWSFGCLLYECLTGVRAFAGESISAVVAAVFTTEPDWSLLPAGVPPGLPDLLRRCIEREPGRRWQSIREVRLALERARAAVAAPAAARRLRGHHWGLLGAAVGVAAGLLGARLFDDGRTAARLPTSRLRIAAPAGVASVADPVWSRDGRRVVFRGTGPEGRGALYVRELDSFDSRLLPGTEGATAPFLSPDGLRVGFQVGGSLREVAIAGGEPRTICGDVGAIDGAAWLEDGTILLATAAHGGLLRVDGHRIEPLTGVLPGEIRHAQPEPLPGGRQVLFTVWLHGSEGIERAVARLDLATRTWQRLFAGSDPRLLASDHVLFRREDGYYRVAFDPEAGLPLGAPVPVPARSAPPVVSVEAPRSLGVSGDGSLAFVPPPPEDGELRVVLGWSSELP